MRMDRNIFVLFQIGLIFFIFVGSSYGQDSDWSVRVGATGIYKPEYEGSDDYEYQGLPMIAISWRDMIFLNPNNGLGAYLWNRNDVKIGASIGYSFGRNEHKTSDLHGLGDIDGGATANILFEWKIEDVFFDARYEQQFTGEDTGCQIHIGLGYDLRLWKKIMFKPSVRTTFASSDYMEKYFNISQSQSLRSCLPVYDSDSGFKSVGFQIMSMYILNRHWGFQTMARYDRLVGGAADSPVVKDENQYLLGLGFSYAF
jgi:MipA family protein